VDVRSGGENIRRKTGPSEIRTAGKAKGPRTHVWAPVGASGWAVAIVRHGPVVVIHARHGALRLTNPNFRTSSKPDCQTACGLHLLSSVFHQHCHESTPEHLFDILVCHRLFYTLL